MSPVNIIKRAVEQKLDIIGITDHNSTLHGPLLRKLGMKNNIFVLTGAEVTTREEVHCLTFFENDEMLGIFQEYLDQHMQYIKNKPEIFGYQVVVDENDFILQEIDPLLITGIKQSIGEVEKKVHELGGLFIPAHVNKKVNSILGNLGFFPPGLVADGIEVSGNLTQFLAAHPEFRKYALLQNSDAHQVEQIGKQLNILEMDRPDFFEIKMALHQENNRKLINL
jgi:PHP family Zn ribbon phosphoesterase